MLKNPKRRGFTLIELLVVIAILALLMSIIIITLNPAEILRKARDTKWIVDLSSLRTALNLYVTDVTSPEMGTSTWCFASLPVGPAATACTNECNTPGRTTGACSATPRLTTGPGWIPVNFNSISSGSPLSALPVDPKNSTSTSGWFYYAYGADNTAKTFELNANMESVYFKSGGGDVVSTDGGNSTTTYEVGSAPGLNLLGATTTTFYAYP